MTVVPSHGLLVNCRLYESLVSSFFKKIEVVESSLYLIVLIETISSSSANFQFGRKHGFSTVNQKNGVSPVARLVVVRTAHNTEESS